MRIKTSITLPKDLLQSIDREDKNRSALIERAIRLYLGEMEETRAEARDMAIINANLDYLNEEAEDVLGYQKLP